MTTAIRVAELRTSAKNLRTMSSLIAASRALTVYTLAGPETWVGPTAQSCFDALIALRRQLQAELSALGDTARILDRRADELEQRPVLLKVS
jgi:hypothetical protein